MVKISDLPVAADIALEDLLAKVDDPAGTPITERATFLQLRTLLGRRRLIFNWVINNGLAVDTEVDEGRPVPFACDVVGVRLFRRANGNSGSTIVDVNNAASGAAPVTLYTTQANRPTVTSAAGDWQVVEATLPDIVALAQNSYLTMDVDQIEGGGGPNAPQGLVVQVEVEETT